MSSNTFSFDPDAVLDFEFDWSAWLQSGDALATHTVTADDDITVVSSSATSTVVTAWLSGGAAGNYYDVVCHVTTTQGRQDERTLVLRCEER